MGYAQPIWQHSKRTNGDDSRVAYMGTEPEPTSASALYSAGRWHKQRRPMEEVFA